MKRKSSQGFTLVEMLTVMLIISILTGLIVAVATLANKKSAASKTDGEIHAIETAIASYKADNGSAPRAIDVTEQNNAGAPPIDPRADGNPNLPNYQKASLFLYQQLSGDSDTSGNSDGIAGKNGAKVYMEFKDSMLGGLPPGHRGNGMVSYLQDPYGFSYGYSTAGAANEDIYRKAAASAGVTTASNGGYNAATVDRSQTNPTPYGYNVTFDLWSTAGLQVSPPADVNRQKWIKNW